MKRETMKWGVIFVLLLSVTYAPPVLAGSLEPPPGEPGPTMHTLEDIYRLLLSLRANQYCSYGYRFYDLRDGTVLDCLTGLVFLKDAYCFVATDWEDAMEKAASLQDGMCGLTDGSASGDWRLPGIAEWEFFVDLRFDNPAVSNALGNARWSEGDPFFDVRSTHYWSSDSGSDDPSQAYIISMQWGHKNAYPKTRIFDVWPVRVNAGP